MTEGDLNFNSVDVKIIRGLDFKNWAHSGRIFDRKFEFGFGVIAK